MAGMEGIGGFDEDEDFYEEDEPLEKILSAFDNGVKGITAPPVRLELSGPDYQHAPTSRTCSVGVSVAMTPVASSIRVLEVA